MNWRALLAAMVLSVSAGSTGQGQQSPPAQAMLQAAGRGNVTALRQLLAAGASVDPVDEARRTPLLLAVAGDHLEAAKLLIDAGASINAQAANQDSPWLLAGALGRTEMLRHMIPKGPDFSLRNRYGGNALIPACERGHVDTVRLLLTTRIDVNHVNNLGWTCLLEIVILGDGGPRQVEITKLVLAAGANPNLADKDGVSPLAHAKTKGQREVAALIAGVGGQ